MQLAPCSISPYAVAGVKTGLSRLRRTFARSLCKRSPRLEGRSEECLMHAGGGCHVRGLVRISLQLSLSFFLLRFSAV